jgi:hypothetical protein
LSSRAVDADVGLASLHGIDTDPQCLVVSVGVGWFAEPAPDHQLDQIGRPDKAADMGGQDAALAALHRAAA